MRVIKCMGVNIYYGEGVYYDMEVGVCLVCGG